MELSKAKAVTEGWLAQQLRPYGLRPRTIRIGERTAKGHVDADLLETYRRYIPRSALEALKAEMAEQASDAGKEANGQGDWEV